MDVIGIVGVWVLKMQRDADFIWLYIYVFLFSVSYLYCFFLFSIFIFSNVKSKCKPNFFPFQISNFSVYEKYKLQNQINFQPIL